MFSLLFASAAFAQAAGNTPPEPGLFHMLLLPVGFLLIMYFIIIRPQHKKAKEHAQVLANLKVGDEVVTTGGLIGKVRSVAEGFVTLNLGPNTSVKVMKHHVTGLTKGPDAQAAKASGTPQPVKN